MERMGAKDLSTKRPKDLEHSGRLLNLLIFILINFFFITVYSNPFAGKDKVLN